MNESNEPKKELPEAGIVQIDGKAATSIRFARHVKDDGVTYDLTYRLGNKTVGSAKGLSLADVDEAIGEKNADKIHRMGAGEDRGGLRGEELSYHYGTTPEGREAAKLAERANGDELNRTADRDGSVRELPEGIALAKKLGITPEELDRRLQNEHQRQEASGATATNVVTRNRLHVDDFGKQPEGEAKPEQDADKARRDSERAELRGEVEKQFLVRNGKYYFKDNSNRLAIEDRGNKLVSAEKDSRVAVSMAKLAEAKGWDSIKVKGSPEFQREVWLEASSRGVKVQGYKPTEADLAALDARKESRLRNSVEQGDPERQRERGKRPAREEPTPEKIEALRKKKQQAEDYNLLRPDARQRIEKTRVVEAVSAAVATEKIRNPATRQKVAAEVKRQLDQMSAKGRDVPTIHTYDKTAPAKARSVDKARTQVERNTERTK